MKLNKEAIVILTKYPQKGRVKTRLAKDIGDKEAVTVYSKLVGYTLAVAGELNVDVYVYIDEAKRLDEFRNLFDCSYSIKTQSRGDLGERIFSALSDCFGLKYEKVLVLGSDCPTLTKDICQSAFDMLDDNDLVLGPTEDGGYYLVALKSILKSKSLFEGIEWSSSKVLNQTIEQSNIVNMTYTLLPKLFDIDDINDLNKATDFPFNALEYRL